MKQKLTSVRDYVWSRFWLRDALSSGIFFCLLLGARSEGEGRHFSLTQTTSW